MITPTERQAIADKWTNQECFLDGKPAKIIGRVAGFATVYILGKATTVEFAWETVDRIMQRDKRFKS